MCETLFSTLSQMVETDDLSMIPDIMNRIIEFVKDIPDMVGTKPIKAAIVKNIEEIVVNMVNQNNREYVPLSECDDQKNMTECEIQSKDSENIDTTTVAIDLLKLQIDALKTSNQGTTHSTQICLHTLLVRVFNQMIRLKSNLFRATVYRVSKDKKCILQMTAEMFWFVCQDLRELLSELNNNSLERFKIILLESKFKLHLRGLVKCAHDLAYINNRRTSRYLDRKFIWFLRFATVVVGVTFLFVTSEALALLIPSIELCVEIVSFYTYSSIPNMKTVLDRISADVEELQSIFQKVSGDKVIFVNAPSNEAVEAMKTISDILVHEAVLFKHQVSELQLDRWITRGWLHLRRRNNYDGIVKMDLYNNGVDNFLNLVQ